MPEPLFSSDLTSLPLVNRGKVRDIYAVGDDHLLILTSDRLSAFDVVLPTPIPGKGAVLTAVRARAADTRAEPPFAPSAGASLQPDRGKPWMGKF